MEKNEKPILFSGEMVKKILSGEKTMTRRVVKTRKSDGDLVDVFDTDDLDTLGVIDVDTTKYHGVGVRCPYGKIGDLLWIKESFYAYGKYRYTGKLTENGKKEVEFFDRTLSEHNSYRYASDETLPKPESRFAISWHKRPSIFMPRIACRQKLEITNIKVERLQDISATDISAEGLSPNFIDCESNWKKGFAKQFAELWDKINGNREGCSWESNPFVFAIEFKKV